MRFEARELKPYAEHVTSGNLRTGQIYFSINYVDDDLIVPTMEPLVFIGKDLQPGDAGRAYFQDVDSFSEGVRYESASEDQTATFISGSENEVKHIFEFERGLDELLKCSLRRRKA